MFVSLEEGNWLFQQGQVERARDCFSDVLVGLPRVDVRVAALLGRCACHARLGHVQLAREDVAAVLELQPQHGEALARRGALEERLGLSPRQVLRSYNQATASLGSDSPLYARFRARAEAVRERVAERADPLPTLVEDDEEPPELFMEHEVLVPREQTGKKAAMMPPLLKDEGEESSLSAPSLEEEEEEEDEEEEDGPPTLFAEHGVA